MANVNDVDQHKRVFKIVNLYLEKIKMIAERDAEIVCCSMFDSE